MSATLRLSIAEYDRLIEQAVLDTGRQRRIELIQGEVREMHAIGPPHEVAVDQLNEWSLDHVPRRKVWVRIQNSIGLPELESVPEPDVAWVARRDYRRRRPTGADVLLLMEVADSSLDYDRLVKGELYAAAGIKDYWIVNLVDSCVEVYRQPRRGRYVKTESFAGDQQVRPLAFPRLALPVSLLFPG
jgi:Uma2 family endonuclease